jgi:ubiquitin C-terminal hydrolase
LQGADYCNGGHHDSQELLNWFLQILSEANNRVKMVPSVTSSAAVAVTAPSSKHGVLGAVDELAERQWQADLARESSVIHDVFQGQTQSCVVCCKCGTTSSTYETFTSLQVALHKDSAPPFCPGPPDCLSL